MQRRLGIFCFYNEKGTIERCEEYLLKELDTVVTSLYIVVNGKVNDDTLEMLKSYGEKVFIRDNTGYDGGAYADFIVNELGKTSLKKWDEVVLCNGSFFGPFVSFKNIFDKMEKKPADFWGIRYVDREVYSYLESYFLVFRKKIMEEDALYEYLYTNLLFLEKGSYLEICSCFERGLFAFLIDRGYKYSAFAQTNDYDIFSGADINVIKYSVPILKKKSLNVDKYGKEQLVVLLDYLEKNSSYDISIIKEYVDLENEENGADEVEKCIGFAAKCFAKYGCEKKEIKKFLEDNPEIYIFGAGLLAGNMWWSYKYLIREFKGFVISDHSDDTPEQYFGEPIYRLSDVPKGSCMIVAVNKKNTKEVISNIQDMNYILMWDMDGE